MYKEVLNVDYDDKVISLGEYAARAYTPIGHGVPALVEFCLVASKGSKNLYEESRHYANPKILYQGFTQQFGITPSRARNLVNKLLFKLWVVPYKDVIFKLAYRGFEKRLDDQVVREFWDNIEMIIPALEDKQESLVPLLMGGGVTVCGIKSRLTKRQWKKLIQSSVHRAKMISNSPLELEFILKENICNNLLRVDYLRTGYEIERSVIREVNRIATRERFRSCKIRLQRQYNIIADTFRFHRELEKQEIFQQRVGKLTASGWERVHDNLAEELLLKKDKQYATPFRHRFSKPAARVADTFTDESEGVVVTYLNTPAALRIEGDKMHHCVGTYSRICKVGGSVIFSIQTPKYSSTLQIVLDGFNQNPSDRVRVGQHYGSCNSKVSSDLHNNLAKEICSKISSVYDFNQFSSFDEQTIKIAS